MSAKPARRWPFTPRPWPLAPALWPLTIFCLLSLLAGCPQPEPDRNNTPPQKPLAGVTLKLAVADDDAMAAAITQLRGEWDTLTGGDFHVQSISEKDLAEAKTLPADAVICPAYQLGPLAEAKLIAPLPQDPLETHGADWADIFDLLRTREALWGTDTLAVPFGSPVLTCYYRQDLLEDLHRQPPRTWQEYQELAVLLALRFGPTEAATAKRVSWSGALEPLGPGWAGLVLLARAAPYAKHRDNYSTLFSISTMEPLVAGPPFVRALEELVAAAEHGPPEQVRSDPAAVRQAFWQGKCGLALSWPSRAAVTLPSPAGRPTASDAPGEPAQEGNSPKEISVKEIAVGFVELPGSQEVYNVGNQSREKRAEGDDPHVPLLAIAGRIGVVSSKSRHPRPACQLLLWLSGKQLSQQVSAASPATTLFRRSDTKSPQAWVEPQVSPAAAKAYAATTQTTLSRQQWLFALRIPGRAEYLAALDEAVHRAVSHQQSAAEALQEAAARWQEITQRLGPENQKNAYLRSLGLDAI